MERDDGGKREKRFWFEEALDGLFTSQLGG